jgi:hypothetical protein
MAGALCQPYRQILLRKLTVLPAFPTHAETSSGRVLLPDLFGGIFRRGNHRCKFARYAGQWNQTADAMSLPYCLATGGLSHWQR